MVISWEYQGCSEWERDTQEPPTLCTEPCWAVLWKRNQTCSERPQSGEAEGMSGILGRRISDWWKADVWNSQGCAFRLWVQLPWLQWIYSGSTEKNTGPILCPHPPMPWLLFTFFIALLSWKCLVWLLVDLLMVSLPVEGKPHENQYHICLAHSCVPRTQKNARHMVVASEYWCNN